MGVISPNLLVKTYFNDDIAHLVFSHSEHTGFSNFDFCRLNLCSGWVGSAVQDWVLKINQFLEATFICIKMRLPKKCLKQFQKEH